MSARPEKAALIAVLALVLAAGTSGAPISKGNFVTHDAS
jgi:hypothetical protein